MRIRWAPTVDRDPTGVDLRASIPGVVVEERSGSPEPFPRTQSPTGRLALQVPALDCERQRVACRNDDAGGPDLDLDLVHASRRQRLNLVVGVEGAIGRGQTRVQLAVRRPQ